MASFLDKVKIKTAKNEQTKLDLSCDHISTANFMQYNVAYSKEMVPGEKIDINMETFTRLAPMPVPTFGRARINNRAFFVPFRTIFPGWNDFITNSPHVPASSGSSAGLINSVPTITNKDFISSFRYANTMMERVPDATATSNDRSYDILLTEADGSVRYYKLGSKGRQFLKIIESLGYKILWDLRVTYTYSALPLLAVGKVYLDWYYNSQYYGSDASIQIERFFKNDTSLTPTVNDSYLIYLINVMDAVNYDSDYFVSAWDNPSAPNDGLYSSLSINDPTMNSALNVQMNTDGTPFVAQPASGIQTLSKYALTALQGLTDYMKRHQLVGARALDRYLARFGITLSAEKLNRSIYIGTANEDIKFGDIMSTADTEGANLGNYAGKGIGYQTADFNFSTDEYGILIIISTIQPKAGYYQGINRNVLHTYRTDFWTPEFDNLGTQAIAKTEVFLPMNKDIRNSTEFTNGVFGWTPRYAEYKIGRDSITGDFRYNSLNLGTDSWHTMRELDYTDATNIVHNQAFVTGQDAGQYSRIFYNTNEGDDNQFASDKFNVIYHFDIASYSPMKSLYDVYEFEEKGKDITMDAGGVKMN